MRVSDQQIFGALLNRLQEARAKTLAAQEQIASGKRVIRPSDDPSAFGRIVSGQASLARLDQRLRNIQTGTARLQTADGTLTSVTNVLTRVKELAVGLRNDTNGPTERAAGAVEARQLALELQRLANTTSNGQALFTGTSTHGRATGTTLTTPVTITGGSTDTLQVSVDGTASGPITLTAGSYTGAQAAALLETKINTDATLAAAGKRVTVSYEGGRLVIASTGAGSSSTVTVTGGTARTTLGFNGGSTTTGAAPYALQASAAAASGNTGGATISQGSVQDATKVTLNDYVIKFSSATTFNVYNVSAPVAVTAAGANTGAAAKADAGVSDATALTLDDYEIEFTSDTQYTITDTTTGTVVSAGNTYTSGAAITFDGLRVVLQDGAAGGPKSGDKFTVALNPTTVLSDQTYASGSAISFDGLSVAITTGSAAPAAGDRFAVTTGIQYQGDDGLRRIEIGDSQTVKTNLPGNQVFSGPTLDLFASLKSLISALKGSHGDGIDQGIADTDRALDQVAEAQAEIGALANRFDQTRASLEEAKAGVTQAVAEDGDADLVKAVSDLSLQQFAMEAAAQAMARILDSSLLRFLR
ncbi:flagellin N-terminal helical domain-containing protein [Nitrospira sp. Kam-Ns4a]